MSFYGNRIYQLTNAFGKFLIKNSGLDVEAFITPGGDYEANAEGLKAAYTFDTGNKWITLQGAPGGVCQIYHNALDSADQSNVVTPLTIIEENDDAIQLESGSYFQMPQLTYDNAGHVTGTATTYFRMPVNPTSMDLTSLQERMMAVEENDGLQDERLQGFADNYATNEALGALDARTVAVEDGVAALAFVGTKDDFNQDEGTTIVSVIGDIKDLGHNNLAEAIQSLQVKIVNLELANAGLLARVEALEKS